MLGFANALCSLLLAAAILLAPAAALAERADCDCKKHCPMHAQKLGCHERHSLPCHGAAAGVSVKSAGCHHEASTTASLPSWRGIMPRELELSITLAFYDVPSVRESAPVAPTLEPPPHPPKLLSVVA